METARYFKVLRERKWVIVLVTLMTAAVVLVLNLLSTPTYTATVKLRVAPFATNAPDYGSFVYFDRLASTYSELVNSDVVMNEALEVLNLEELPDYSVTTIPQTELLRLDVVSTDPVFAQSVANTLATILVEKNRELFSGALSDIQDTIGESMTELQAQIDDLVSERAILETQIPRDNARIAELTSQITSRQRQYDLLLSNSNQALVSQANLANALTIVQLASAPDEPSSTSPTRMTVLASVIGLLGGVALAFILEAVSPRLYSEAQVSHITNAPIRGRIPRIARRFSDNVYAGDIFGAEAFRRLSASIISKLTSDDNKRIILVTSAIPGEGKSTVAANLARSLARSNRSVALVDCDMRRPAQHTIFEVAPNEKTLRNVLTERTPIDDALESVGVQNLKIIPGGTALANSTELLNSDTMVNLTTNLKAHFDTVILDAPAILAAPDSLVLTAMADDILLVVDLNRTSQATLAHACEQLHFVGVESLNVVVNRVKKDVTTRWRTYYPKHTKRALN